MDPFASIVLLPYRFTDEMNKVLVFTEVGKPELFAFMCFAYLACSYNTTSSYASTIPFIEKTLRVLYRTVKSV